MTTDITIGSMLSIVITFAVAILTGVLANGATYLVVNVLLPWYRAYIYTGVIINGTWLITQSEFPADGESLSVFWTLTSQLEQKANILTGTATAISSTSNNAKDVITYRVSGYIYDRLVSLNLKSTDQSKIAYSNFLLEVAGDGSKMTGYRNFYGLRKGKIRTIACIWRRQGTL